MEGHVRLVSVSRSKDASGRPSSLWSESDTGHVLGAAIFLHDIAEVQATGINWTFPPCVMVPRDERWGRTTKDIQNPGTGQGSEAAAREAHRQALVYGTAHAQIPINAGDANYDPLFRYGFGLTY